jgi:hypothetical protein
MATYRLGRDHYLNDRLYKQGDKVTWDKPPSRSMIPLDAEAKERKAEYEHERSQRKKDMNSKTRMGWTPGLQKHLWAGLEAAAEERNGEPPPPMPNVKIVGRRGRPPKPRIDLPPDAPDAA